MTEVESLVGMVDISPRQRLRWAHDIQRSGLAPEKACIKAINAIKRQCKAPRYTVPMPLRPVVAFLQTLVSQGPASLAMEVLLPATIVALRLLTMLRSTDLEHMHNTLLESEGKFYVACVQKGGKSHVSSVQGFALRFLREYLWRVRGAPGPRVFRWLENPNLCLGSQRIAKVAKNFLGEQNINTDFFKAHALRGAAASQFLSAGVPFALVQAQGGWADGPTLQRYYNQAAHQVDWFQALQAPPASFCQGANLLPHPALCPSPAPPPGEIVVEANNQGLSQVSEIVPPSCEQSEATRGDNEEHLAQSLVDLAALGILRKFAEGGICPRCKGGLAWEAAYRCAMCSQLFHVRCMARTRDATQRPVPPLDRRQWVHHPVCSWCRARACGPRTVVDVMGVCVPEAMPPPPYAP